MKRYKLYNGMMKSSNGDWVEFKEAVSRITELVNKIKTLETTIQQLNKKRNLSGDH